MPVTTDTFQRPGSSDIPEKNRCPAKGPDLVHAFTATMY